MLLLRPLRTVRPAGLELDTVARELTVATGISLRTRRVLGLDNQRIGRVKEVQGDTFLVDRTMKRDVYVPLEAVQNVTPDGVILNVESGQVDNMDWANPPLTDSSDF